MSLAAVLLGFRNVNQNNDYYLKLKSYFFEFIFSNYKTENWKIKKRQLKCKKKKTKTLAIKKGNSPITYFV